MSVAASIQKTMTLGGVRFPQTDAPTGDGFIVHDVSIDPGDTGSLITRTDANTGVVTVDDSGHAIIQTDRVDVYWSGGCRRGMEVTNVSGALVTIDGGSGDDLPIQGTTLTVIEPTLLDVVVLGTNVNAILMYTDKLGQFTFVDSVPTEHYHVELGEGCSREWMENDGVTNPITGDSINGVYVSHGDAAAATMRLGILYDN